MGTGGPSYFEIDYSEPTRNQIRERGFTLAQSFGVVFVPLQFDSDRLPKIEGFFARC